MIDADIHTAPYRADAFSNDGRPLQTKTYPRLESARKFALHQLNTTDTVRVRIEAWHETNRRYEREYWGTRSVEQLTTFVATQDRQHITTAPDQETK